MPKNENFRYKTALKYIWEIIKPYKMLYIVPSLIVLVLVAIGLLQAKITQLLVDSTSSGNLQMIIKSLAAFLFMILLNVILTYAKGVCISKLAAEAGRHLKLKIAHLLLHARYGKLIKLQAGDTIQTVNSDTAAVCSFIGGELISLFSQFAMALGGLIYLIYIDPLLAIATFAYTPVGMFFTLTLNKKMNRLYPVRSDSAGQALSVTEQVLSSVPVIKSFIAEKQMREKIQRKYEAVFQTDMKISKWDALIQTACASTSMIPRMTYLIFSGYLVVNGSLSIGTLIAVYDLISYIIGPTVYFPFLLNGLNRSIASISRISRLDELEQPDRSLKQEHSENPGIKLENVSFSYDSGRIIIHDLSFKHNGPGIIAVCGKSGSGKTTLIDLIAGLYKQNDGEIKVSGSLAVVSQDAYIFNDNIYENVRIAKPDASDDEVKNALKLSGADNFAENCMDFTDLSGGQKQRISLARAILTNADIWLLDEPTSALDSDTEKIILDTIKMVSKDKLILVSAHRQSLIDLAERRINL
jgi:ABC-type multidrug transport system fused ATPase/permease subunit